MQPVPGIKATTDYGERMNTLCFASNLTSTEWAAWLQAIGSILAILGATGIAVWQARKQHNILRSEKGSEPVSSAPQFLRKYGAGTKSRTRDLLITNQLLYQLSYAGFFFINSNL